ncbi:Major facilitator superfamily domain general substrate transporter [Penicillium brevicompactum]|uniref:Major facilitator superfamily domain general substrate transporter n=1 Tax=Penicillium brevicompactum TaxID=5074 RepID=A0A9W9QJJ0_PENBR|nr:Major facilitator superfamily domain general substrate transporter [Penicillium brevicompactum]
MSIDGRSNHLDASETTPPLGQPDYDVETASSHKDEEEPVSILSSASSISGGLDLAPNLERLPSNSENVLKEDDYAARFIDVTPTQFWIIFGGILVGYMIGFFDSTLMASSHPVITSYFNAANSASWLSTAFLLTSTAFMPLFGRVSDAFGRKPVYLFSIAMFFITTAGCGLARNIGHFIAARALCGLGAGGIFSIGQIISSDLVRLEYRGIYQSYINLCLGAGGSIGLAFGGYLCDHIGWRGAFFIQLPFIFVYFIAAAWTLPANLGRKTAGTDGKKISQLIRSIDILGSFMLITAVTLLIVGLNLGGNVLSWSHPLIITSLTLSFVFAVILVLYEPHVARPVMPIELLTTNPRSSIIFGSFFASVSINTVVFNAPLYFQAVKLTSPTSSGLRLVASSIAITISSVSTGFLINATRRLQPFVLIGVFSMIVGGFAAAAMGIDTSHPVAMACISFSSFGQGFAFPSLMVSMLATSKHEDQAVATTTLGLWRSLGSVMGVAVSSWIFQNALIYHLNDKVTGVDKDHIIALVRKSVHSISQLDPVHQLEGMFQPMTRSYSDALRMTFFSAAVWAIVVLGFMCRIRLPRLRRKE